LRCDIGIPPDLMRYIIIRFFYGLEAKQHNSAAAEAVAAHEYRCGRAWGIFLTSKE